MSQQKPLVSSRRVYWLIIFVMLAINAAILLTALLSSDKPDHPTSTRVFLRLPITLFEGTQSPNPPKPTQTVHYELALATFLAPENKGPVSTPPRNHASPTAASRSRRASPASPNTGQGRTVTSTAYCLTGTMADGQRVHSGAVAMNGVPLGSVWQVQGGSRYTVEDRIGHGTEFDIWMSSCEAANRYGRHDGLQGRPPRLVVWRIG